MPFSFSNTGSTALREAEVQQPKTEATLSLTSSFFAFSAKVGQSLAPSSWMNLILRPSTPPVRVDLLDGELLGLDRAGLADRHGAGDGVQDADRDLGVGHREPGGVDLRGRKLLRHAPTARSIAVADSAAAPARSSRRVRGRRDWEFAFRDDMRRLYPA